RLNADNLPHNPMLNSGAIAVASLIRPELPLVERFKLVIDTWTALADNRIPTFNNAVHISERSTADRNMALAYFMHENHVFPPNTDLLETLDLYFRCCSIEQSVRDLSLVGASLANLAACPTTGLKVFDPRIVENCLSLMFSCGMYNFSGEFAFRV